jgi:hypothetical protein
MSCAITKPLCCDRIEWVKLRGETRRGFIKHSSQDVTFDLSANHTVNTAVIYKQGDKMDRFAILAALEAKPGMRIPVKWSGDSGDVGRSERWNNARRQLLGDEV